MTEEDPKFYEELDEVRRSSGGHSCCTIWTLGLLLVGTLILGLVIIFGHHL